MSLAALIHEKAGIRIGEAGSAIGHDAQMMIAALLVLVAKSDGGISTDESLRMVRLLRSRFDMDPGEALNLINRAGDELAHHDDLDDILAIANDSLTRARKEDLMSMVLDVIAADDRKDAAEMQLLIVLIDGLQIPDSVMSAVYERYFAN